MSKGTVVLVDHPVGKRDDRASRMIAERGYALRWYCPGKGDALPAPSADHVAAVVYGGAEDLSKSQDQSYIRHELDWIEGWIARDKPFLGICLGAQLLAQTLGARVAPHPEGLHEIGYFPVDPTPSCDGFLDARMHVYHWHKEGFEVPSEATLLATGDAFPNQAFRFGDTAYGLQFHPEVSAAVMQRWLTDAEHMLAAPGACTREQQLADSERYDQAMLAWFEGFLDDWLPPAD